MSLYSPFIVVVLPVHLQQRTFDTFSSTSTVSRHPPSGAQSPHFEVSGFEFMHLSVFLIPDLRVAISLDLSIIDPDSRKFHSAGGRTLGKFLVFSLLLYISHLFSIAHRFGLAPSPQPLYHIEVPVASGYPGYFLGRGNLASRPQCVR